MLSSCDKVAVEELNFAGATASTQCMEEEMKKGAEVLEPVVFLGEIQLDKVVTLRQITNGFWSSTLSAFR